jgi:membrane protein DedA with SNARE-associated domain
VLTSSTPDHGLTGLSGWLASVMESAGEVGVGLLTALETVFPPIPSEAVLPLAGFLTRRGDLSLPLVLLAATVGSYVGALVLYGLGAWWGRERASRAIARIPLVDREDVDRASDWFDRHGRLAVFSGRLVPGVRSLISLPAGATRMPLVTFTVYTVAGSALWNGLLVGGGVWLGDRWDQVERYAGWLDVVVVVVAVLGVGWLVRKQVLKRRRARSAM